MVTPDDLLSAEDIGAAVDAAIGPDGLNLAETTDVLTAEQIQTAVTEKMQDLVASGQPVTEADIQAAIEAEAVVLGQVVSVDQSGLATAEQVSEVGDSVDALAELIGKPSNLITQEDIDLATAYLDSVEQENELLYDVDNSGTFDQTDVDLMQTAFTDKDYSGFVDSEFGLATGMFATQEQDQATIAQQQQELEQAQIKYEQDMEAQRQADIQAQTQLRTDFQEELAAQDERAKKERENEELLDALSAPGRTRTTQQVPLADIGSIYDFESIFRDDKQEQFYGSASPYGDNFLNDILFPQQKRAKGGMIKDKTDEILKIMGGK